MHPHSLLHGLKHLSTRLPGTQPPARANTARTSSAVATPTVPTVNSTGIRHLMHSAPIPPPQIGSALMLGVCRLLRVQRPLYCVHVGHHLLVPLPPCCLHRLSHQPRASDVAHSGIVMARDGSCERALKGRWVSTTCHQHLTNSSVPRLGRTFKCTVSHVA